MTNIEIRQAARRLAASRELARVMLRGDPFFGGVVLRWGTVTGITSGRVTFSGLHDCAGIAERDQSAGIEHIRAIGPASAPLESVRY